MRVLWPSGAEVFRYVVTMTDMEYGLTRDIVMSIVYSTAEKSHGKHPFSGESAGRS